MPDKARGLELELEQAHALLDQYGIARIDPESMMILSVRGRLEMLLEQARQSDQVL